jgi:hypothetical protein
MQKNSQKHVSGSPCSPRSYGAAQPYAITLWRMPAKLTGDLTLPLLNTPIKAARAIFIIFNELSAALHHSGFFAFPIDALL